MSFIAEGARLPAPRVPRIADDCRLRRLRLAASVLQGSCRAALWLTPGLALIFAGVVTRVFATNGQAALLVLLMLCGLRLAIAARPAAGAGAAGPISCEIGLSRSEAPKLWGVVEEVCRRSGVQTPAEICLIDDNSASICIDAKPDGLSPHVTLRLGLSLLLVLPEAAACAIVAHEIGHLLNPHAEVDRKIRNALDLAAQLKGRGHTSVNPITRCFARWLASFAAQLAASSAGLWQAQEFHADQWARRLVGADALAQALLKQAMLEALLGDKICTLAEERRLLEVSNDHTAFERAHDLALADADGDFGGHPGLAARLGALGVAGEFRSPAGCANAARAWIDTLDECVARFDVVRSGWISLNDKVSRGAAESVLREAAHQQGLAIA